MLIGYARVSTHDQNLALQEDALKHAGCDNIFTDQVSGAKTDRPGLQEALQSVSKGDALVVYSLSRLARSTRDTLDIADLLTRKGADLVSISEKIDTTTAAGKMVFLVQ